MSDGIYVALSGAVAQEQLLDVIANDLANASTTGYKGERLTFEQVAAQVPGQRTDAVQVTIGQSYTDHRQGGSKLTGRDLDVALQGAGFFAVRSAGGEQYTRAGSFTVSPESVLTTLDSRPVMGQHGPITFDKPHLARIDDNGAVWQGKDLVDVLKVVQFADPRKLERTGSLLYQAPEDLDRFEVTPKLQSGALEQSNVNSIRSMADLVIVSRAYETYQRTIETFRSVDQKTANNLK